MGFTNQDLGCCCVSTCTQNFTVAPCGGSGFYYPGLTVSVYSSSGGTLLGSGTTNSSSVASVSFSGTSGTYWITISGANARFATYGASKSLTCGGSTGLTLSPASGYACFALCSLPLATTIYCNGTCGNGVGPPSTITNAPFVWSSSGTYGAGWYWTAGASCLASTGSLYWGSSTATSIAIASCPPSFSASCNSSCCVSGGVTFTE